MPSNDYQFLHDDYGNEIVFSGEGIDPDMLADDGDVIILSNDAIPKELGTHKKVKNNLLSYLPIDEMKDDDDIIDYFYSNQDKFTPCQYFL